MSNQDAMNGHKRIVEIFEAGKRFTEELLRENERLRLANENLHSEVKAAGESRLLETQALAERVELQERECARLRAELRELRDKHESIERENSSFAARHLEVERQNASLLNMYVANQRLTSTLDFDELLVVLGEIVINLIGSECYEILLLDSDLERAVRVSSMGVFGELSPVREWDSAVRKAVSAGRAVTRVAEGGEMEEGPIACLPLATSDGPVSAIVIHELLPHKAALENIDHDLFELLTEEAGAMLWAAHWYTSMKRSEGRSAWSKFVEERANQLQAPT